MPRTKGKDRFRPAEALELQDIALWSTSLERDAEYEPALHAGRCHVQTIQSARPELYSVSVDDSEIDMSMLRVFVSLGVRSLFRDPAESDAEPVAIFTLEATFAVDYLVKDEKFVPSEEEFSEFVEFNCVHNAWPFWRQHVYDTLKRASLPVPAVPLFAGKPSGRSKKVVSRATRISSREET